MDLNKDNKDIYSIDRETYSTYMKSDRKESTNLLDSIIKLLLLVLVLILSYFTYYIIEKDLSFKDVFNKNELHSAYNFFEPEEKLIEEKTHIVAVSKNIVKPKETMVIPIKSEVKIVEVEPIVTSKEVIMEEPIIVVKKVEVKDEPIVLAKVTEKVVENIPKIEEKEQNKVEVLSESYLDLMTKELNSL